MKNSLFKTELIIEGNPTAYTIQFENERYHFKPFDSNTPDITLIREHDEWHVQGNVNEIAGRQAISALEHYLISQH
ncbi:MAG: hypothetical protein M3413_04660 [Bacteroidota bacterium]|jgi:hypothetical protein|nr:hypothetical protein [Bacteroidota bacterium]